MIAAHQILLALAVAALAGAALRLASTTGARGLLRVLLTTTFVVLVLELAQHYFVQGRSFDVDDLVLAAIGAAIGYVPIGRYLSLRVHPAHRHWWQRLLGTGKGAGRTA